MQNGLFFAISATACLISGNFASAEEVGSDSNQPAAAHTSIANGAAESPAGSMVDDATIKPRVRGGGNVEWRRGDHGAPNPNRSSEQSRSGKSDSSGGGGGSGSGGGGSTD